MIAMKRIDDVPNAWKESTLGEVAEINPTESITRGKKVSYVAMDHITPFSRKILQSDIKEFKGGMKFRNGDTLLARITPCLENGKTSYVDILDDKEVGFGSTEYIVIREKKNLSDRMFLYYFAISPHFRAIAIKAMSGTSGRQRVQTNLLINKVFSFPSLPEQRSIANVLSSLDDKIELLRDQNNMLEAIAQAIYKEWFVKFNFSKSSNKMTASSLGEIPNRWRVGPLTDMFDFMEGPGIRNWQYTKSGRRFINIRLIQDNDINIRGANFISEEEAETTYKHFHLQEKDMVVSTSGTLGRCAIVRKEHLPLMLNTSVIRFRPIDKISYGFMYQYLNSNIFKNELESFASGSVQLNFGPVHLKQIEMLIPSEDVLQKFAEAVNPLYEKICFNLSQVQTLATLRDTVLPKLMKGEVRVKGFDK